MTTAIRIGVTVAAVALSTGCIDEDAHLAHSPETLAETVPDLLRYDTVYSAYDGVHDYQLVPSAAWLTDRSDAPDAVDPATLRWSADAQYVRQQPYAAMPAAELLTMQRSGVTQIEAYGKTRDGRVVRGVVALEVSEASTSEWEAGASYFDGSQPIFDSFVPKEPLPSTCGLPVSIERPSTGCASCHSGSASMIFAPCSPLQTAPYSDARLIETFAHGELPFEGVGRSPFFRDAPMSECIFDHFHQPQGLDEMTTRGLVWKLRSLAVAPTTRSEAPSE